jgi:hypothetical protein
VTLQLYTNVFSSEISEADTLIVPNCSGTGTLSHGYLLAKTAEAGALVADTFYAQPPNNVSQNTLNLVAAALFAQYGSTIRGFTPAGLQSFVQAPPHTSVAQLIYWKEEFVGGTAKVSSGQSVAATLLFAIPKDIQFSRAGSRTQQSC